MSGELPEDGEAPVDDRRKEMALRCYRKATEAMSRSNFDYTIEMMTQCCRIDPGNLMYRQVLRGAEEKKYNNNKTGSRTAFLSVTGIRTNIKKLRLQKNWAEIEQQAEKGLALNPWDFQFNIDLGDALRQQGYQEVALFAYQTALKAQPDNQLCLSGIAELFELRRDFDQARGAYERLAKLDPNNGTWRSKVSAMMASRMEAKIEGASRARDVSVKAMGYEDSVKGGYQAKNPNSTDELTPEKAIQREIKKDPQNPALYHKLAEFYRREDRLDEAVEQYRQAFEINNDPIFREQMEDIQIELLKRQSATARERVAKEPDNPANIEHSVRAAQELLELEIAVLTRRIERYPNDMKLKFELSDRHMRSGNIKQAIPLLQQATSDQRIAGKAYINLGKCFLKERLRDMAKRQFDQALTRLDKKDDIEEVKYCHYTLARMYEEANKLEQAEHHYSEVVGLDYEYKGGDALHRMQEIQRRRGELGADSLADELS